MTREQFTPEAVFAHPDGLIGSFRETRKIQQIPKDADEMSHVMRKPVDAISAQSDQRLCCSLRQLR